MTVEHRASESESAPEGAGAPFVRLGWRIGLAIVLLVVIVQTLSPDVEISDSRLTVPTADAVIHGHLLNLAGVPSVAPALRQTDYDIVRRGDDLLPLYPWPPMLLAVPATAVAALVGVHPGTLSPSAPNRTWPIEIPTAAFLTALAALIVAKTAADFAQPHRRARLFGAAVGLIFAFATSAWSTASRALWQDTPAMLASSLIVFAAVRAKRDPRYLWLLGFALTIGYTMRPTMVVLTVVMGIWAVVEFRRASWRLFPPALAVAVPFVAVNLHFYGRLLAPYYTGSGNGLFERYGFLESLGVQLVSPSRGLLIYTPLVLLAIPGVVIAVREKSFDTLHAAVVISVVLYVIVVSMSGSPAGTTYGSRFFTDILPLIVFLTLPFFGALALDRRLGRPAVAITVVLVAVSFAMTLPGALTHGALCWSATPNLIMDSPQRVWDWSDPQFFRPVAMLRHGDSLHQIVLGSCPANPTAS